MPQAKQRLAWSAVEASFLSLQVANVHPFVVKQRGFPGLFIFLAFSLFPKAIRWMQHTSSESRVYLWRILKTSKTHIYKSSVKHLVKLDNCFASSSLQFHPRSLSVNHPGTFFRGLCLSLGAETGVSICCSLDWENRSKKITLIQVWEKRKLSGQKSYTYVVKGHMKSADGRHTANIKSRSMWLLILTIRDNVH